MKKRDPHSRGNRPAVSGDRIAALDGLCAIAGAVIVLYHSHTVFGSPFSSLLSPVYEYGGYWGNYMFFIISGFLISLRYKDRLTGGAGAVPFLLKRLRRLYPTYFLSNLAMILAGGVQLSLKRTAATFLMVSTGWFFSGDMPYNFPAWFLCVLMLCYVTYCAAAKISARFPAAYLPLCCALIVWGAVLEVFDWDIPFLYRVCGEGLTNFFLGALLRELWTGGPAQEADPPKGARAARRLACPVLVCLTLAWMLVPGGLDVRWWISLTCAGLTAAALSIFARSLTPLQAAGRRCLSLSLWHIPVLRIWQRYVHISWLDGPAGLMLYLLIAATVSFSAYSCIEQAFPPQKPLVQKG